MRQLVSAVAAAGAAATVEYEAPFRFQGAAGWDNNTNSITAAGSSHGPQLGSTNGDGTAGFGITPGTAVSCDITGRPTTAVAVSFERLVISLENAS